MQFSPPPINSFSTPPHKFFLSKKIQEDMLPITTTLMTKDHIMKTAFEGMKGSRIFQQGEMAAMLKEKDKEKDTAVIFGLGKTTWLERGGAGNR